MKKIIKIMDVITKNEQKEDKKAEEFYKVVIPKGDTEPEENAFDLSPVEELSCRITDHLAQRTSQRFADMVNGKEMGLIKQIISRLDRADSETAVEMLQAMFLLSGKDDEAKDLDIINMCAVYNETAYDDFIFELFDTDEFDWFVVEICMTEACDKKCPPGCFS